MNRRSQSNSPVLLVLGLLVLAIAVRLYTYTFDGNITGFFQIGSVLPLSPYLDSATTTTVPNAGYDGQFFLTIALDPLLQAEGSVAALDSPGYRYRRILYPLLGHILGAGQSQWIPYALVGINLLCILALAWLIWQQSNQAWRSLAVLTIPGLWAVLTLSTADGLSALLAVLAIITYRNHQPGRTAIALSLACLTRETMLLQWGAIALASVLERRGRELRTLLLALPLPLAWNLYVIVRARAWSGTSGFPGNFVAPLSGLIQKGNLLIERGWLVGNVVEGLAFLGLLLVLVATLMLAWRYRQENLVILTSATLYLALLLLSGRPILEFAAGHSRVYLPVYCCLLLINRSLARPLPLAALSVSGLVTGKLCLDLLA